MEDLIYLLAVGIVATYVMKCVTRHINKQEVFAKYVIKKIIT